MGNSQINNFVLLVARVLMSVIYIWSGWGKLTAYSATAAYMQKNGVPGLLLPLVILVELGGGLAILAGFRVRVVAFLLAGFTLLAGLVFHLKTGDRGQMIHFTKNLAIAGGFLALMMRGGGAWSIDGKKRG